MSIPLKNMINESSDKNPISILNEYCLKTSTKVNFEFKSEDNQFTSLVIYNNEIIGKGTDKKKQAAKTKAAQKAVKHLLAATKIMSTENETDIQFKALSKKGKFQLSFIDPNFIYQFYDKEKLLAEGKSITEPQAKQKCVKKTLKVLKTLLEQEKLKTGSKSVKDIRKCNSYSNVDLRVQNYLENKLKTFQVSAEDLVEIGRIEQEVILMSKHLGLSLIPVGSYAWGLLRKQKLVLDYCLVLEKSEITEVYSIYESLEKSRMLFLESKEHNVQLSGFGLSLSPSLIQKNSKFPTIKLESDKITCLIYFYESLADPSLQHYLLKKSDSISVNKKNLCTLFRHWKFIRKLDLSIELLDLIVEEFVMDEFLVYLGFRLVLEMISGGIFLNGACNSVKCQSFEYFIGKFDDESKYKVMAEAQKTLISLSTGETQLILD